MLTVLVLIISFACYRCGRQAANRGKAALGYIFTLAVQGRPSPEGMKAYLVTHPDVLSRLLLLRFMRGYVEFGTIGCRFSGGSLANPAAKNLFHI
jgi:hypothetical protein